MKYCIYLIALLFSYSCLFAQDSNSDFYPQMMMNPSTAKEGAKAVEKALGISDQSAIIDKGRPMTHQAIEGIVPVVFVRAGSSEAATEVKANSPPEVLRLRGGGPKLKSGPTGGLKSTGDSDDEEDSDRDEDPNLNSEDKFSENREVNKYLKNEIINNIYTECLAEVAKLTLNGCITAENFSKEADEWAAAKAAAEYYRGKYEGDVRVFERDKSDAKEAAEKCRRRANEAQLTLSKKAKELDQLETQAIIARAAYAESDYELKKLALQLAEARVGTARATCWAIEMKNNPSRSTAEAELAECQKKEIIALESYTKAKTDVEAKAILLKTAEEKTNQQSDFNCASSSKSQIPPSSAEAVSSASIRPVGPIVAPVLSDDIAEEIGRRLLGKIVADQETQALSEPTINPDDEARWDAREKADQLAQQVAIAKAHMKRWHKKNVSSAENQSTSASVETRSRADSTASVESALGSINDLEEGKAEESIDSETAAKQKRQCLLDAIDKAVKAHEETEETWKSKVYEAEAKNSVLGKVDDDQQNVLGQWMEIDRVAVDRRASARKAVEMKAYCAANAERWMVCAEVEKIGKAVIETAMNNTSLLSDLRNREEAAKKRWLDLGCQEESVIEARNKSTIALEEAIKELQKKDLIIYQLWTSMVSSSQEKPHSVATVTTAPTIEAVLKTKAEYFKEVEDTQNLAKETAATKQYAKAIKQEGLQQALTAVLEGKESSVKAAWHSKLVESAVAARKATLLAQRPPNSDWKTDEPRRTAQRTINVAKADKAAFDTFHEEIERFSGIKANWMVLLEEAARSHAEGDMTAWDALTEEERNVYNTITLAKNKAKEEAVQRELEKAEKEVEKARHQVEEAWIPSTKAAREAVAKKAEDELERMKINEAERQKAIRWPKLTPEERKREIEMVPENIEALIKVVEGKPFKICAADERYYKKDYFEEEIRFDLLRATAEKTAGNVEIARLLALRVNLIKSAPNDDRLRNDESVDYVKKVFAYAKTAWTFFYEMAENYKGDPSSAKAIANYNEDPTSIEALIGQSYLITGRAIAYAYYVTAFYLGVGDGKIMMDGVCMLNNGGNYKSNYKNISLTKILDTSYWLCSLFSDTAKFISSEQRQLYSYGSDDTSPEAKQSLSEDVEWVENVRDILQARQNLKKDSTK